MSVRYSAVAVKSVQRVPDGNSAGGRTADVVRQRQQRQQRQQLTGACGGGGSGVDDERGGSDQLELQTISRNSV